MKLLKDAIRGCKDLPHCGPHPGNTILLVLMFFGTASGVEKGLAGVAVSGVVMLLALLPLYLTGAVSRARLERKIERELDDRERTQRRLQRIEEVSRPR